MFLAQSLAGPKDAQTGPSPAQIRSTNFAVYGNTDLGIPQWVSTSNVVDSLATGTVPDWLKKRMLDLKTSHAAAFSTLQSYSAGYVTGNGTPVAGLHPSGPYAAQSPIVLNPYFLNPPPGEPLPLMRLSGPGGNCGVNSNDLFAAIALHEIRHTWQYAQVFAGGRGGGGTYYVNDQDGDGLVLTGTTNDGSLTIIDSTNSRTVCDEFAVGGALSNKSCLGPTTKDAAADVGLALEYDAWLKATP